MASSFFLPSIEYIGLSRSAKKVSDFMWWRIRKCKMGWKISEKKGVCSFVKIRTIQVICQYLRAERTFAAVLIGFHRHRGRTESRRHVATRQRRHLLRYTPGVAHTRNAARGESDEVLLSPESDLARINLPLHHQSGRRHFQCPSAGRQRPSPWRMCRASRRTVQARRVAPA